ncbi:MAG: glycosyltransferase [Kiritimatiellaeota bacterium]|nr:glycosyltransferase [Kiritimatiellota bacterium]
MKLSVLIPVFNERYTLERVVEDVLQAALPDGLEREIVIVDDASTDGTAEVVQRICARHPAVASLRLETNQGKGAALRAAIQQAAGDFIVFQDADLEYSPADYGRLLAPILAGHADVVYGSRFLSGEYRRVLYFWHSLGNRALTTWSNMLTNLNLSDMETCYKMARADLLKSIPIRCNRFGVEPELTAKFAKRGCRIYEAPITYRGRTYGEGKKITWRDGAKAIFIALYFRLVDDLYDERYGHAILHSLSATHRFNRWMADAIRPWVGERVLEIGAGLGNLTRQLLPRDEYTVSDIDPLHLHYLTSRFAVNGRVAVRRVDAACAADFQGLENSLDTIVCLNVLEHIVADGAALANFFAALAPGGCALILVPQHPRLAGSLDEVLGHVRRYTRKELTDKLVAAGFRVERVFSFNRISVPGWWFNGRVLQRRHFGKLQLKIFDSLVGLWRHLDRWLPWSGISLIAVARKPPQP